MECEDLFVTNTSDSHNQMQCVTECPIGYQYIDDFECVTVCSTSEYVLEDGLKYCSECNDFFEVMTNLDDYHRCVTSCDDVDGKPYIYDYECIPSCEYYDLYISIDG
jgi:hypothetical protein